MKLFSFFVVANILLCIAVLVGVSLYFYAVYTGIILSVDTSSVDSWFCLFYQNQITIITFIIFSDFIFYKSLKNDTAKEFATIVFTLTISILIFGNIAIWFAPIFDLCYAI